MNGDDIINTITIIICSIALIPSVFLIIYQKVKQRKGIDVFLNYVLCSCCIIESVYYFLGMNSSVTVCHIKGVLMVIADIMRMSIGLIKLLLLRIEHYQNLGIEQSKTTEDDFLFCMTFIFTLFVPIIFGLSSLLWGNINYTTLGNCYPYNTGYKLFLYILSILYYFIFFFFLYEIVVKAKLYQEKMAYTLREDSFCYESITQTQTPIFTTLLSYGIVQALNFFLILMFLVYLFLERFTDDSSPLRKLVGSYVYKVFAMIVQCFLFLLFLIIYGYHSITLKDIKDFICCRGPKINVKTYNYFIKN